MVRGAQQGDGPGRNLKRLSQGLRAGTHEDLRSVGRLDAVVEGAGHHRAGSAPGARVSARALFDTASLARIASSYRYVLSGLSVFKPAS